MKIFWAIGAVVAASIASRAGAQTVPLYSEDALCGFVKMSTATFNACIEQEQEEYNYITLMWHRLHPDRRQFCLTQTTGPKQRRSYSLLSACVEAQIDMQHQSDPPEHFQY